MSQIILYGMSGVSQAYKVLSYRVLYNECFSITSMYNEARRLRIRNPDIEHVYAIDNRYGLKQEYLDSINDRNRTIEGRFIFKDILEREGLMII